MSVTIFAVRESRRSDYEKKLKHILREYEQIVVEVDRLPKVEGEVVEVNDFEELVNVHDTVEKPIIYKEVAEGHCSVFMIEDGEVVYSYAVGARRGK
jgi:trehalose-6-phosphate synthase